MERQELLKEVRFRASRSSGSGGQNVNKVATKVELIFDVKNSYVLTEAEKQRILTYWATRVTQDGVLLVSSEASRSQLLNKNNAIKKFQQLIAKALQPIKERAEAGAFTPDKRKRLDTKTRQSHKKANRRKVISSSGDDLSDF